MFFDISLLDFCIHFQLLFWIVQKSFMCLPINIVCNFHPGSFLFKGIIVSFLKGKMDSGVRVKQEEERESYAKNWQVSAKVQQRLNIKSMFIWNIVLPSLVIRSCSSKVVILESPAKEFFKYVMRIKSILIVMSLEMRVSSLRIFFPILIISLTFFLIYQAIIGLRDMLKDVRSLLRLILIWVVLQGKLVMIIRRIQI